MKNDPLTEKIIGLCFDVHKALGPGYKENIYKNALMLLFKKTPLAYETEKPFRIEFQGHPIGLLRVDLIIEGQIIIEIKAVNGFTPKAFESQVIAYLKGTGLKTGLLINFGNSSCNIRRIINEQNEGSSLYPKLQKNDNHCDQSRQGTGHNHRNHVFNHRNHPKKERR